MIKWQVLPVLAILLTDFIVNAIKHGEFKKDEYNVFKSMMRIVIWLSLLWLMGVFE